MDSRQPYAFLVEPECSAGGHVEDVATLCSDESGVPVSVSDVRPVAQHDRHACAAGRDPAADRLTCWPVCQPARHIKLYNSGNFFDHQAIPPEDYAAIADRVRAFETVIVENHPQLCGDDCLRFRDLLDGQLEIALGLETVHEQVLERLNKRMTLRDYERAVGFLLPTTYVSARSSCCVRPSWMNSRGSSGPCARCNLRSISESHVVRSSPRGPATEFSSNWPSRVISNHPA